MHALGSWCERYRSGTGARQSDRSSLWIKTRSALRLYFARSAPRSLPAHMLWAEGRIRFSKFFPHVGIVCSRPLICSPLHKLNSQKVLFTVFVLLFNKTINYKTTILKYLLNTEYFLNVFRGMSNTKHSLTYTVASNKRISFFSLFMEK